MEDPGEGETNQLSPRLGCTAAGHSPSEKRLYVGASRSVRVCEGSRESEQGRGSIGPHAGSHKDACAKVRKRPCQVDRLAMAGLAGESSKPPVPCACGPGQLLACQAERPRDGHLVMCPLGAKVVRLLVVPATCLAAWHLATRRPSTEVRARSRGQALVQQATASPCARQSGRVGRPSRDWPPPPGPAALPMNPGSLAAVQGQGLVERAPWVAHSHGPPRRPLRGSTTAQPVLSQKGGFAGC